MPLPPDFADISNIGRSRDKAVCRSGEEKGKLALLIRTVPLSDLLHLALWTIAGFELSNNSLHFLIRENYWHAYLQA